MAVKQTTNGKTANITDTIINLETLRSSMPEGSISDYSAKQRLLDAMDNRLKREVKPHITATTSHDELVEIAEKRDAILHSTGVYGHRNHQSNAVSNAVTQPQPKRTQNNQHNQNPRHSANSTMQYHRQLSHAEKERRQKENLCFYCGKHGH